jgi:integrase
MTMSKLMERRGMVERPHGFRSSFRDWVAETTNTTYDVAETALGHVTGSAVERSYRRTDFLEQRWLLLKKWSEYLAAEAAADAPKTNLESS